jgi:hypothetical protein
MNTIEIIAIIGLILTGMTMLGGIMMVFTRLGRFHGETIARMTGIEGHLETLNGSTKEAHIRIDDVISTHTRHLEGHS